MIKYGNKRMTLLSRCQHHHLFIPSITICESDVIPTEVDDCMAMIVPTIQLHFLHPWRSVQEVG